VISTPNARLFGSERIFNSVNFSNVLQHAQRSLAERTQFFVRAACRNSVNFGIFSREFSREIA